MNYIFDNAAESPGTQRFSSLESLYDEDTIRHLERTGLGAGWRCLEVGGGSGSIATWMADRVGDEGSVLVTDIDPRFLKPSPRPNVEICRHDIGADTLPDESFDLIHARLVLIHVSDPWGAIKRLVASLKRGGWLVIEDFDPSLIDRSLPCTGAEDAALTTKIFSAMRALMQDRGLDVEFARNLYAGFVALGLVEVGMEGHVAVRPGRSVGARLDRANLSQIRDEAIARKLLTPDEVDQMLTSLEAENFAVLSPMMFSAWGRQRGQDSKWVQSEQQQGRAANKSTENK
jgi:SAM-dependent methyltransferase